MLGQCIRALRKLGANRNNIFVFDDEKHPLPYQPPNTQYTLTTFNRRGNLNGTECVNGELWCMYEAAKISQAHVVVKVDSDVIVNSLDWILEKDFMCSHIGFHIGENKRHISGCCYSLPTWSIIPMIRALKNYPPNTDLGESFIIGHLADTVGLSHEPYECSTKNTELWRASSILDSQLSNEGEITPHSLHLMKNLDVVLCDLITTVRDKHRNYLLMKSYLDACK